MSVASIRHVMQPGSRISHFELEDLLGRGGMGVVEHFRGDEEAARSAWRRSISIIKKNLEVNPKYPSELRSLAMTYAMLGQRDTSLAFVDNLMSLPGLSSSDFLGAAKAYEILGERQLAIAYLARAIDAGHSWASIEASAWLDDLREDPDFKTLIRNSRP